VFRQDVISRRYLPALVSFFLDHTEDGLKYYFSGWRLCPDITFLSFCGFQQLFRCLSSLLEFRFKTPAFEEAPQLFHMQCRENTIFRQSFVTIYFWIVRTGWVKQNSQGDGNVDLTSFGYRSWNHLNSFYDYHCFSFILFPRRHNSIRVLQGIPEELVSSVQDQQFPQRMFSRKFWIAQLFKGSIHKAILTLNDTSPKWLHCCPLWTRVGCIFCAWLLSFQRELLIIVCNCISHFAAFLNGYSMIRTNKAICCSSRYKLSFIYSVDITALTIIRLIFNEIYLYSLHKIGATNWIWFCTCEVPKSIANEWV